MSPPSATNTLPVDRTDVEWFASRSRHRLEIGLVRLWLAAARNPRPLDPDQILENVSHEPNVLVLCAGNICRSPFAERYLRDRLPPESGVAVRSAGFVAEEDRPSPQLAVETATEFGVSLADHASVHVTPRTLSWSDLVVVMDAANYAALARRHRETLGRVWFLLPFAEAEGYEIPDPHGGNRETFRSVYGAIADAADGLTAALAAREP